MKSPSIESLSPDLKRIVDRRLFVHLQPYDLVADWLSEQGVLVPKADVHAYFVRVYTRARRGRTYPDALLAFPRVGRRGV